VTDVPAENELPTGEVRVEPDGAAAIVVLHGEHDLTTAGRVRVALDEAVDGGRPVVLDVSGTSFMDTSVLHALFSASTRLKADGRRLVVQCPAGLAIYRVFEVSGLVAEVAFCETREDALAQAGNRERLT